MTSANVLKKPVSSVSWQDYRGSNTGWVVYYSSDPVSELPIREVPEDMSSAVLPEPNYETGTYGLYGCEHAKTRVAFVKAKNRYIFFMTKYAGTNEKFKDKVVVTGYFRIDRVADARRFHIKYCEGYSCLDSETCPALHAIESRFVSLEDSLVLEPAVLTEWGFSSRITRQTRIPLSAEHTAKLVEYLSSKPDATHAYVEETKRLQPHGMEGEEKVEETAEEAAEVGQPQA